MKITRRGLFGFLGAGAAAAVLPKMAEQTTVKLDPQWSRTPCPADTFTLHTSSSIDDFYPGRMLMLDGRARVITRHDGGAKTLTLADGTVCGVRPGMVVL